MSFDISFHLYAKNLKLPETVMEHAAHRSGTKERLSISFVLINTGKESSVEDDF